MKDLCGRSVWVWLAGASFSRYCSVFLLSFPATCRYSGIGGMTSMDVGTITRPELAARRRAVQAPFAEIVEELARILGKKLTAYVGGVKDTRHVDRWSGG